MKAGGSPIYYLTLNFLMIIAEIPACDAVTLINTTQIIDCKVTTGQVNVLYSRVTTFNKNQMRRNKTQPKDGGLKYKENNTNNIKYVK